MVMPLVPSYNTKRVFGTWVRQAGTEMRPGTYKVTVPVRVVNSTDDVIIPAGVYASGTLNVTNGVPSFDLELPCTDDTDNSPIGWQVIIEIAFADAPKETYVLDIPVNGGEINLRTVILAQTIPVPQDVLIRGVAGGLAELDADGTVPLEQLPGGLGGADLTSYEEQVTVLPDYPSAFPTAPNNIAGSTAVGRALLISADATAARTTLGATTVGHAVFIAASQAAARTAIGAGTSSLVLGSTSTTAKAGDWKPTSADVTDFTAAVTALVSAAISATVNGAPGTLDTLGEIADALNDDPNFATTITNLIAAKAPLASPTFSGTVSGVTKAHVGLGNVDNTSDANKPVSTAQSSALALKAPLASPAFTGTPTGITKTHVGLGNVDNTSDANKPVSTAQAAAIAQKAVIVPLEGLVSSLRLVIVPTEADYAGQGQAGDIVLVLAV